MDPVNSILGNNDECYVCGKIGHIKPHSLYLTDYGVRTRQTKDLCASCISASKKGIL